MNFREKIQELETEVFKNMGRVSQLTINMVNYMFSEQEPEKEHYTEDELLVKVYDIDLILDIIAPYKVKDIEILSELRSALETEVDRIKSIENGKS